MDWQRVWRRIKNTCVKTVMCGHQDILQGIINIMVPITKLLFFSVFKKESQSDYNSYKLFGVDFFLDDAMKPWLLELNNFPSMEKASLDRYVNDPMIAETYNVAGFHFTGKPTSKQKQVSYMTCSMIMSSLESEP